jgi:hypothetical protein
VPVDVETYLRISRLFFWQNSCNLFLSDIFTDNTID